MASYYDVEALKEYVRKGMIARGNDPNIALKVWTGEGLSPGVWQSNVRTAKGREPSFGPFQMLVGGGDTGYPEGMGNAFTRATGLDPRDPKNVYAMADYAMNHASKKGYGEWYAARDQGIGPMAGIGANARVMPVSYTQEPVAPRAGPPTPYEGLGPSSMAQSGVQPAGGQISSPAAPSVAPWAPGGSKASLLQQFTREGGTGGLGSGPQLGQNRSGAGPQNLAQALQMGQMKETMVDPIAKGIQGLAARFTGKPETTPAAIPVVSPAGSASTSTGISLFDWLKKLGQG